MNLSGKQWVFEIFNCIVSVRNGMKRVEKKKKKKYEWQQQHQQK